MAHDRPSAPSPLLPRFHRMGRNRRPPPARRGVSVMPAGRPSEYSPELGEKLIAMMAEGFSLTAAAAEIGVHRDTIYEWAEKHAEFSDAVKIGRGKRVLKLERDLLSAEEGPRVTARIFALKNACPDEWREKIVNEHTGKDGGAIETKTDDVDLARRLAFLLARGAVATDDSK